MLLKTLLFASSLMAFLGSSLHAVPEAQLWTHWQQHNPQSTQTLNHQPWDQFLQQYLVTTHSSHIHLVKYAEVSQTSKEQLWNYLQTLENVVVTQLNRDEQKAYWINTYNALTIHVILKHFPVSSIKDIDISPGWFSFGPWDAKLLKIEGKDVSLNDIEHRILRPIWKDPRVHYAVNCASMGCPNLAAAAYTHANTEDLLEAGARDFINHARGVQVVDGELKVSSIFDWFQMDFGATVEKVKQHWLKYAEPELKQALEQKTYEDWDHDYDWSLNQATK